MQRRALTLLLVLLSLAACGRKGALDAPNMAPTPAASSDPGAVQPTPPPKPDKHFFLDPLI